MPGGFRWVTAGRLSLMCAQFWTFSQERHLAAIDGAPVARNRGKMPLLRVPPAGRTRADQDSGDCAGGLRSRPRATLCKVLRYVGLDHQQAGRQKQRQDSRKCQAARDRR